MSLIYRNKSSLSLGPSPHRPAVVAGATMAESASGYGRAGGERVRVRVREVPMEDIDRFDEELKGAMRNTAPPADFAARTARRAGETEIRPAGVRPVVWGALAAAACLLLAVIVGQGVQDRRSSETTPLQDAVALAPAQSYTTGPAFVAKSGKIAPYRGRTNVKVVWNFSQNAPELIVEAFPWED